MAFESQFITVTANSVIKVSFWIYLVNWVLALVLGLAFVFYFHRLLGFIFSLIFKLVLWKAFKIRVNVESLKVSPLGGRLFIKNLTIITSDYTVSILNSTFTWRYWLYRLTRLSNYFYETNDLEDLTDGKLGGMNQKQNEKQPSRFLLVVEGFEVFMHNRTFAYDHIMDILNEKEKDTDPDSSSFSEDSKYNLRYRKHATSSSISSEDSVDIAPGTKSLYFLLQLLPIYVKIKKGAFVMGNITTPSILVASYKNADATIDIAKSLNKFDFYRFLYDFAFDNFQLWMKPNIIYDNRTTSEKEEQNFRHIKKYKLYYQYKSAVNLLDRTVSKILRRKSSFNQPEQSDFEWKGLRRYIGDNSDDAELMAMFNNDEQYAKYSLILDSVTTRIIYYYDAPGIQPIKSELESQIPPEHGVEMEISMGTIHYGPWADRQRVPLQNMFFPPIAKDSKPATNLTPGSQREYDGFKITMIVKDEVIIRIPTRESSKDKQLLKSDLGQAKPSRAFGWLEIKLSEGSNISSFTSYIANSTGFPNKLKVQFNEPEVRSSVNHDVLFLADQHQIDADIGFPLKWNGKCDWKFDQVSINSKLFLLREHTLLFSDLFTDFASGEPQKYEYFRPFLYQINWKLINYKFFLNVNDFNIINNPLDFENNKYLSFQGREIDCNIKIPLYGDFAKTTTVTFDIITPWFDLILDTPPWHTANAFLQESKVVGKSSLFKINGSYTFYNSVEVNTSNFIEIRCIGDEVSLKFYGFVIRYLFTLRENYFGDHTHFQTFEEYTNNNDVDSLSTDTSQEQNYWKMIKTENDEDILFTFKIRSGLIILPYHLYSCQKHIGLNFDILDIDMRFCNYYMDMQVDFSPISGVLVENYSNGLSVSEYVKSYVGVPDMLVDGFSAHSHRMFGIPPSELTFWCNWSFYCGDWIIDSNPKFMKGIVSGINNFGIGFSDQENALDVAFPPSFDAANFSFQCSKFLINLRPTPSTNIEIILSDLVVGFNDMPNLRFSNKVSISIPEISVKVIEDDKISAFLTTSLIFSNICQKKGMVERREKMELHVRDSDAPFHRAPFVMLDEYRDDFYNNMRGCFLTSLTLPEVPYPLNEYTARMIKRLDLESDGSSYDNDTTFMAPTCEYDDDDFTPNYDVESDTEYDSFIIELGDVNSYISPSALNVISQVCELMEDNSVETLMDEIDVHVVKLLNGLLRTAKSVKNFRLVNRNLQVKIGEYLLSNIDELTELSKTNPHITLQASDISIAMSESSHEYTSNGELITDIELSMALHIKDVVFSISQPLTFYSAAVLDLQDIEFWFEKIDNSIVGSGNDGNISLNIDDNQVEWLIKYISTITESFISESTCFQSLAQKNSSHANLVYALSKASRDYYIDHDPDVLTRPAYILRTKKEHIRFFDNWKIVARLRHILQTVPPEWCDKTSDLLQNKKFKLPSDAYSKVVEEFANWRAWEANHSQRIQMLKAIFSINSNDEDLECHFQVYINEILIKLASQHQTDFISLSKLSTSINQGKLIEEPIKTTTLVFNLEDYESKIGTKAFDNLKHIIKLKNEEEPILRKEQVKEDSDQNYHFTININSFIQQIYFPTSTWELKSNSLLSTTTLNSSDSISSALNCGTLEFNTWFSSQHVFSKSIENAKFIIGKTEINEALKLDLEIKKIDVQLLDKSKNFPSILQTVINTDIPYIENTFKFEKSKTESTSLNLNLVSCSVKLREVTWNIEILSPFIIAGSLVGASTSITKVDDSISFDLSLLRMRCNLDFNRHNIIEFQSSEFKNFGEVDFSIDGLLMLIIDSSIGYVKLLAPNLIYAIGVADRNIPKLQKRFDSIVNLISKKTTKKSETIENRKDVICKINFLNNNAEVSTFVHKTKVSLNIESTSFGVHNVSNNLQVPVYGDFHVPVVRFSILERTIPIGLSNLVETNFSVKLLNDLESSDTRQSLQFESQFCRICLSEQAIFKIIKLIDDIQKGIPKKTTAEVKQKDNIDKNFEKMVYSKISSFQFLSYNFCLGWIFNDESKDYPGIIIGAERFFAATEESLGKFTLMEAYLSVANGSRSSNFYSTSSEKNNLNRAFLPNLQLSYLIEKKAKRHMRISMHGDEIDIKFLSTSVASVIAKSTKSASNLQLFLERRATSKNYYIEDTKPEPKSEKISLIHNSFEVIEFISTFAGSNVLIYRLEDDSDYPPSLYLHAPAMKTAFKYINVDGMKRKLIGELLTTSSDNILYPKCVPVILDVIQSMKGLMRKKKSDNKELIMEEPTKNSDFFKNLIEDMDVHIGVRIESQKLSLSCEPTAKVAAIVGLEGIFIQVNTNESKIPTVTISLLFDLVQASLQHIYSRDISASASISSVLLSSVFELGEVAQVYSTGSITDVDGFINVKQYQDVDLFKDIWFPKDIFDYSDDSESESENEDTFANLKLARNKNISSRFKEVSSTYAFPWVVTFIVSNVKLGVHFGQSLGNFTLVVDDFWAVSKKSPDWSQDLKIGFNSIKLTSEGRLGGSLIIHNINLHTAISWKLASGITLDVPLILVSGGIEKLHLKMSFDYHVIAIANIESFSIDVYNKKSEVSIAKDHLIVCVRFKTCEVYMTSLTASNFLDIQNTITRMILENKRSYKETLKDSSRGKSISTKKPIRSQPDYAILETLKKLETKIHVEAGKVLIHIYPSSIDNSKVLVIKLDESRANFLQNEYSNGISNQIDLKFNDLKVSLSNVQSPITEEFLNNRTVEEFVEKACKTHGGTIFIFPSFKISMRTFQKVNSNQIDYLFQSSFDGKVDIRWNLGSVNFIREMYSIHSKALASRMEYKRKMEPFEENIKTSNILKQQLDGQDPTKEIDDALKETIEKVESSSKFIYSPIAQPIIEAPQLKELGNATPPLEWFGLHRDKFPNVTHQLAIVSLQKLIHEIELQYSKMLGKA
ncbi:unnamed protein product [Candida verbasci]|uniref:Protein CSF1 n=1 Tax=Candida verbasci TaxID=1227364 RepID=A0A9W4U109_9ASCO|nr:unnamed protein product [Candida verbasci]